MNEDVETARLKTGDVLRRKDGEDPKLDLKRTLTAWTLLCGGVVILLWGILSFPKKLEYTNPVQNKTCSDSLKICPRGWNQMSNSCVYNSEHTTIWLNAEENCEIYDGTLAKFTTKNEMKRMMNLATHYSYWIGLNKKNLKKLWMWPDRSLYNNLYSVHDHGDCAFIHKNGINSTNCHDLRRYMCMQPSQCPKDSSI